MELLKERILKEGYVIGEEVLKVDSFLNHQMDITLFEEIGREFYRRFSGKKVTKILTIEASGIAVAALTALSFKVPVVFAKKTLSVNLDKDTYKSQVYSFTKKTTYDIQVSKKYIQPEDHVLIIDDFLANGKAAMGLIDIVEQAGAAVTGVGIVIEKGFQDGGALLRDKNVHVESLAIVNRFKDGEISFVDSKTTEK